MEPLSELYSLLETKSLVESESLPESEALPGLCLLPESKQEHRKYPSFITHFKRFYPIL